MMPAGSEGAPFWEDTFLQPGEEPLAAVAPSPDDDGDGNPLLVPPVPGSAGLGMPEVQAVEPGSAGQTMQWLQPGASGASQPMQVEPTPEPGSAGQGEWN